jgi:8-oxo-dGTP pyrophosphatase MutT (NUDIX family)
VISINERLKYFYIIIVFLVAAIIVYAINYTENVVGGIVYLKAGSEIKYLVVTAKSSKRWIFPKGKVKYYESKTHAVLREVLEEAGVNAGLKFKLEGNPFIYRKSSDKQQSIVLYAMEYLNEAEIWNEEYERNRKWVLYNEAEIILGPELFRALVEVNRKLIEY